MTIKPLMERYRALAKQRSDILRKVQQSRDEIASIEERIEDLKGAGTAFNSSDIVRARDKRKRLLADIAENEHEVRLLDAEMETTRMQVSYVDE